jgi:hypothetical protein
MIKHYFLVLILMCLLFISKLSLGQVPTPHNHSQKCMGEQGQGHEAAGKLSNKHDQDMKADMNTRYVVFGGLGLMAVAVAAAAPVLNSRVHLTPARIINHALSS